MPIKVHFYVDRMMAMQSLDAIAITRISLIAADAVSSSLPALCCRTQCVGRLAHTTHAAAPWQTLGDTSTFARLCAAQQCSSCELNKQLRALTCSYLVDSKERHLVRGRMASTWSLQREKEAQTNDEQNLREASI